MTTITRTASAGFIALTALTLTACTHTSTPQPNAPVGTASPAAQSEKTATPAAPTRAPLASDVVAIATEYAETMCDPGLLNMGQVDAAAALAAYLAPQVEREQATADPDKTWHVMPFSYGGAQVDTAAQQPCTIVSATDLPGEARADGTHLVEVVLTGSWAWEPSVPFERTLDLRLAPAADPDDRAWVITAATGTTKTGPQAS